MSMIIYYSCQMQTGKRKKKPPKTSWVKKLCKRSTENLVPLPMHLHFNSFLTLISQYNEKFSPKLFPPKWGLINFYCPQLQKNKNLLIVSQILPSVPYGQTWLQKQTFIASRTKEVSCLQISTNVRKQCFGLVWFFLHYSDRKKARSAPAFLAEFLGWNGLMIYIVHSYELS